MRIKVVAVLVLCLALLALALPAAADATPAGPSGGRWHLVKPGETLSSISRLYGVPVDAIAAVNGLVSIHRIWAGTWLWIPGDRPPTEPPGPTCRTKITVKCGDTLAAIGRQYGVSVWRIAQTNHIANPNLIYPGQRLCIPWPGLPR